MFRQINEAYEALRSINHDHQAESKIYDSHSAYSGHYYQSQQQGHQHHHTTSGGGFSSWQQRQEEERARQYYGSASSYKSAYKSHQDAGIKNDFDYNQVKGGGSRPGSSSSSSSASSSNFYNSNNYNHKKNPSKEERVQNDFDQVGRRGSTSNRNAHKKTTRNTNQERSKTYYSSTAYRSSHSVDVDWEKVSKEYKDRSQNQNNQSTSAGGGGTPNEKTKKKETKYKVYDGSARAYGVFTGEDITQDLDVDFMTGIFGGYKTFQINHFETCDTCSGRGSVANPTCTRMKTVIHECSWCRGQGAISSTSFQTIGGVSDNVKRASACPVCSGAGVQHHEVIDNLETCKSCSGQGRDMKRKTIKVNVPRGVDDGDMLVIPDEGHAGPHNGSPGTLYLRLHVGLNHALSGSDSTTGINIRRIGSTIHSEVEIDASDAKAGCSIEHFVIDSILSDDDDSTNSNVLNATIKTTTIEIPPNTKSGHIISFKGKGAPLEPKSKIFGDHHVTIRVLGIPNDDDDSTEGEANYGGHELNSSSSPSIAEEETMGFTDDYEDLIMPSSMDDDEEFDYEAEDESTTTFVAEPNGDEEEVISFIIDDPKEDLVEEVRQDYYHALTEEEELLMKNLEDQLQELRKKKLINEMKLKQMVEERGMADQRNVNDDFVDEHEFYFAAGDSSTSSSTQNNTMSDSYLRP